MGRRKNPTLSAMITYTPATIGLLSAIMPEYHSAGRLVDNQVVCKPITVQIRYSRDMISSAAYLTWSRR